MLKKKGEKVMLTCNIRPSLLKDEDLLCGDCRICAGQSKFDYPFQKDLRNSDDLVRELIEYITIMTRLRCARTEIDKNPDINVFDNEGNIVCRVEAKYLEGQAFMKSKSMIGLRPKEAIVIDEPKLDSYLLCKNLDYSKGKNIPIFVVWKFDRPCADIGGITVFQEVDELNRLRGIYRRSRAYQRRSAANDYNNGIKLGVTSKYHFSIRECEPIELLPQRILMLIRKSQ